MNSLKITLLSLAAMALIAPAPAEAGGRLSIRGRNPNTGNVGGATATVNGQTGARVFRARGYNPSTQSYQGGTRAYNPATGQGFTSSTSAARGSGATTSVNTVNNGSYECSVSQTLPAHCVETSSSQ